MGILSEEKLIVKIKNGETHLFAELIEKYKDKVYQTAYKFTKNIENSADLSQDIFIKAYENINKFSGKSSFSTWLYRLAQNTCLDWIRKNHKTFENKDIEDYKNLIKSSDNIEDIITKKETSNLLNQAILQLKDKYKDIILMYYYNDLKYNALSKTLNISVKTVETRLYRARKLLLKELLKLLGQEA